jgi:hypothetical protein
MQTVQHKICHGSWKVLRESRFNIRYELGSLLDQLVYHQVELR